MTANAGGARGARRGRLIGRAMVAMLALLALLATGAAPAAPPAHLARVAATCPAGEREALDAASLAGVDCVPAAQPESAAEMMAADMALARRSALEGTVLPGADAAAVRQRLAIAAAGHQLPGLDGTWTPYGHGPLVGDDPRFTRVSMSGYADLGGRVNHFAYAPATGTLYASVGQGGVWALDAGSTVWRSIGDSLPTQAVGGIAWSPAQGGTLLITTGNDVFGGGTTFAGLGAYRSVDGGATWQHAAGIPDGVNSFQVAVDPGNSSTVYAATGAGLFRSTDDGVSYTNVRLPVSPPAAVPDCNGALPTVEGCFLANIVTDVVVRAPGGVGADKSGGRVVAAVGWRAGSKTNTSKSYPSYVESPGNGLYTSASGAPGTFTKIDTTASNFADGEQSKIGRIELGAASGAGQDHGYLYAIVQDATAFQGGADAFGIDVPGNGVLPAPGQRHTTYLKGVYSSPDFGQHWTLMTTPALLAAPTSGTSLTGLACDDPQAFYCPGIQAWYNAWIQPDPTRADSSGVPSRLVFGLEELWENSTADQGVGASGPTNFHVIASYIGGTECLNLVLSFPACPTASSYGHTTLHADEHGGIFVPDGAGGVTLYAGNDGGVGTQHVASGVAISPANWGRGVNNGFNTLMPYGAVMARDGTLYAGLQDNGELRTEPATGRQFNTHDGDGTTSAVDPDNSAIVYERPAAASLQKSTDGGQTWTPVSPSDTWQFNNPVAMDPGSSNHLLDAGNNVWETKDGATNWTQVFSLGTAPSGASYAMSALDLRGAGTGTLLPTGPHTPNFTYTAGSGTIPAGASGTPAGDVPGTYTDHNFTIGAGDGDASVDIRIDWASSTNDWDLYLYRQEGSSLVLVQSSTNFNPQTGNAYEEVVVPNPQPGNYVIRVVNSTATGTFTGTATFTQRTMAIAQAQVDAAYVAFCGYCDALNTRPFANGIATNVGGSKPPNPLTADGWHFAAANGLPQRFITSIVADGANPNIVYVTLAGYSRRWLAPGLVGEQPDPRQGHVFKSTDAGRDFTDISGNLPDGPAESLLVYNGRLIVGTDTGVYMSSDQAGSSWELVGKGLPNAPVFTVALKPKASSAEPDTLYVATHGRGVYTYQFATAGKALPPRVVPAVVPNTAALRGVPPLAGLALLAGGIIMLTLLVLRRQEWIRT